MTFLDSLNQEEMEVIQIHFEAMQFPEGACIIEQGGKGDGCYFIDEGRVRVEFDTGETDTDVVLNYLEPGQVMGEFSLLDNEPRSASLYAHTDVKARWLSSKGFQDLLKTHPQIGTKLLSAISLNLIKIVRHTNRILGDYMTADASTADIDEMVDRSLDAQKEILSWPEEKIDTLLKDLAETIAENAPVFAEATVKESGMGIVEDKMAKIRFASLDVYQSVAGNPASGIIQTVEQTKVDEIASPMGVVLGIIPLTNPVPTMIFKTLICLKSRNALIMSCHRNALGVGNQAGEMMQNVLRKHGAPVHLIQWIKERSSRKVTNMFMRHRNVSFILATGGPSIVKAAYSSGTPAIGVGAGNAPVYLAKDANYDRAAQQIIGSKSFDNGVICGSENNLVVDASIRENFIKALEKHHAKVLTPDEIQKLTNSVVDSQTGKFIRDMVGKSAQDIAQMAGIDVQSDVKLLVVPQDPDGVDKVFGQEKLAPVLPLFTVEDEAQAFDISKRLLKRMGSGHTAIIHTEDPSLAQRYGLEMPASRILENVGGSLGCIGGGNGLLPSLTLGCGTLGGTSTTDNVTYKNLLNIKRVAHAM